MLVCDRCKQEIINDNKLVLNLRGRFWFSLKETDFPTYLDFCSVKCLQEYLKEYSLLIEKEEI